MPERLKSPGYLTPLFLGSAAFVFLNFGLPIRADDLGFSATAIGGMYAVFTLTMLIVRPIVGVCLDRFGRRWFFCAAFVFYTLSMFTFSQGTGLIDFYVARFVQGIGASLMWVSVRTIVADLYAAEHRGEAMGRVTVVSVRGSMIGAVYGFTLLGFMPMQEAWVYAFWGYAGLAFLGLIWSLFFVQESIVETVDDSALPPYRRHPKLKEVFLIILLAAFASALIEPIYLIFLKQKFDVGVHLLAFAFLPAGIVFAVIPQMAGRWSDRFGRGKTIALGVLFAGVVSAALPFWSNLWMVAASYILFAVGWAMADPAIDALVADLAQPEHRGRVIGELELVSAVGAATGPVVGGWLYDHVAPEWAFIGNGLILLCACGLAVLWFTGSGSQLGREKTR
ncbi:MAG: MFS transporter [Pseudomonadota bacterium]